MVTRNLEDNRKTDTRETGIPIFLTLDREKMKFAEVLFNSGTMIDVEGEKPEILPKRIFEIALAACESEKERELVKRVNEKALDQRIVIDIGRAMDQTVKKAVGKHPDLKDGLAIIGGGGFAFMEHEHGSARDLKKALKETVSKIHSAGLDGADSISSLLTQFLPIPFIDSKLGYGTWGRPSYIDEDVSNGNFNLPMSVLHVHSIENFNIGGKEKSGFWSTDVTDRVREGVERSGVLDGYVVVTTYHTTVGMIRMDKKDTQRLLHDLYEVAPFDTDQYYHNKIIRRGELKRDRNGEPLGDGNGRSHVMAALTGPYTIVRIRGGKLDIGDDSILHLDFDTLPPRGRIAGMTIIDMPTEGP